LVPRVERLKTGEESSIVSVEDHSDEEDGEEAEVSEEERGEVKSASL